MSDVIIEFESTSFISNINQNHKSVNYKICSDIAGNKIIDFNSLNPKIDNFYLISTDKLESNKNYYLFVQYVGYYSYSGWSSPIQLIVKAKPIISNIYLPLGKFLTKEKFNIYLTNTFLNSNPYLSENNILASTFTYNNTYGAAYHYYFIRHINRKKTPWDYITGKYGLIQLNTKPIFKFENVKKPKLIRISGYLNEAAGTRHNLSLRFIGNISGEHYHPFDIANCYDAEAHQNGGFFKNNSEIHISQLQPGDNFFEFNLSADELTSCFTNPTDTSYSFELINASIDAHVAGTDFTSGLVYLKQLDILSDPDSISFESKISKPEITSATFDFIKAMSTGSTFEILSIDDSQIHTSSDWKFCSDEAGLNILDQSLNSTDLLTHIFNFNYVKSGYIFVRYNSNNLSSEWSDPKFVDASNVTIIKTKSGRKLYRHESNMGTVIEWQHRDNTLYFKSIILDAKYRSVKAFGSYGTDNPDVNNYTKAGRNNRWTLADGSTVDYYTSSTLPTLTDANLYNIWYNCLEHSPVSGSGMTKTKSPCKKNCDSFLSKYKDLTDSAGIVGLPAIEYCRSIEIFGCKCDLMTFDLMLRVYVECDYIDDLDPTLNDYPDFALGHKNPNNGIIKFPGATYNCFLTCTEYNNNSMRWANAANSNCTYGVKSNLLPTIPVLDIIDSTVTINKVTISAAYYYIGTEFNYLHIVTYPFSSNMTETHISTKIKITQDSVGTEIIFEDEISDGDLTNLKITYNDLDENENYYVFVKHIGSFNGDISTWVSSPLKMVKIDSSVLPSERRLYRHSSGMGSVLEFNDGAKDVKVIILDAKYRRFDQSFGLSKCTVYWNNQTKLPQYSFNNRYGTWSLDNTSQLTDEHHTTPLPVTPDSILNYHWPSRDANTSKYNCDAYMLYTAYVSSAETKIGNAVTGSPVIQYCRSVEVDGCKCDLPNFNIMLRIYLEADNIDALDPTCADFPDYMIGYNNPNGFFFGNNQYYSIWAWTSTQRYESSYVKKNMQSQYLAYMAGSVTGNANVNNYLFSYAYRHYQAQTYTIYYNKLRIVTIPILEIFENCISKPSITSCTFNKDSLIITVKSSAFTSLMNETHSSSSYKLCSDNLGNDIKIENMNDVTNLVSYIFDQNSLDLLNSKSGKYYVFIKYNGSFNGESEWSDPFEVYLNLSSNIQRNIYRHESNIGSILEYRCFGINKKLFIFDAAYRNHSTVFGGCNIQFNSLKSVASYSPTITPNMTDETIDSLVTNVNLIDTNSGDYNSSKFSQLIGKSRACSTTDTIVGVPAIEYCRNIKLNDIPASLPNIIELTRIYSDADKIDNLDPTIGDNPSLSLGNFNPNGYFAVGPLKGAMSSTQVNKDSIKIINNSGVVQNVLRNNKTDDGDTYSIIPVIELTDPIKPIINHSSIFYKNNKPAIFINLINSNCTPIEKIEKAFYKITNDVAGNDIVFEYQMTSNFEYVYIENLTNIYDGESFYLFVKHKYKFGGESEWSDFKIVTCSKSNTPGGRKLYRHSSGMGSVLEYFDKSDYSKVLVLDAKYRFISRISNSGGYSDYPRNNLFNCSSTPYTYTHANPDLNTFNIVLFTGYESNYVDLNFPISDFRINSVWGKYIVDFNKPVKEIWKAIQKQNLNTSGAVRITETMLVDDESPYPSTFSQLLRIISDADYIDLLDPTVDEYLNFALGVKNPNGFMNFGKNLLIGCFDINSNNYNVRFDSNLFNFKVINEYYSAETNIIPVLDL